MDPYRWNLRAQATGRGTVRVATRKHQFEVGAPVGFDQDAAHITALEYALGALGAELVGGLKRLAETKRVEVDHVEAVVQGELNDSLAAIGVVGAQGYPGIERISVNVYVSSSENETRLDALWQEVLETSPLHQTLRRCAKVEVALRVTL